jgi:hypothetical protein
MMRKPRTISASRIENALKTSLPGLLVLPYWVVASVKGRR